MITRHAAKTLFGRGNLSYGTALPVSVATGSRGGGVQRMLASSSKAPPQVRSTTQTKDVSQEAIEKSERLHAELTEVRITRHAFNYLIRHTHVMLSLKN